MTDSNGGAHEALEPHTNEALTGELVSVGGAPRDLQTVLADLAEKAVKTFAQTLLVFLTAGATVSVLDVPWTIALQGAAIATLGTVLLSLVQTAWQSSNPYVEALARAARTFLASFAGVIPVVDAEHTYTFADIPWGQAASIAGTLAVVSLLTSVGSLNIGPTTSPSLVR